MKSFARKLVVIDFVLCFALPAVAAAQKLVVGYSGITAIQTPFWIIKDAGYFKQEGLDANLIYIAASSTMAQAMMGGEVAISTANSQAVVDTPAFRGATSWQRARSSTLSPFMLSQRPRSRAFKT